MDGHMLLTPMRELKEEEGDGRWTTQVISSHNWVDCYLLLKELWSRSGLAIGGGGGGGEVK